MARFMSLLNLAFDFQEEQLFLTRIEQGRDVVKETDARPIANTLDWRNRKRFNKNSTDPEANFLEIIEIKCIYSSSKKSSGMSYASEMPRYT